MIKYVFEAMRMNEINIEQMEYLFLRRKRSSAVSERQKNLLFKAAQRHWEEEFVGKEANIRKVDCRIYKAILYQLEIRQIFLDTSLSLKKLSDLLETNQTYLSNVVNKYFGCNLKELVNGYRVEYAKELLSFGRCALNDLPRSCGFASKSAFYSAFSKRSSAVSERQKNLLFKAAQRHWEEEFVGKEANIRKVDCRIYKAILYQLEIRQIFLDTSLSLKKLSDLLETNQTYLSNVVNKYFGCNLKELVNGYRVEYAKELLSFGRCALNDLPRSCGFASKSAFYSAFSKVAGVSPLSYQSRERRKRELQVINELRY